MLEININEKIIIRKANKNDDLERISELIYNVDPYIYPYWFENLENCKKVLPKLILEDNFIFNIETIYIAINSDNNEIVGLSSIVDKYTNLEYDYEKFRTHWFYTVSVQTISCESKMKIRQYRIELTQLGKDFLRCCFGSSIQ